MFDSAGSGGVSSSVAATPPPDAGGRSGARAIRRRPWRRGRCAKKLVTIDRGDNAFPDALDVKTYIEQRWLPHLKTHGRMRPRSLENYAQLSRDWVIPVIGHMQLRAVRVGDVQRVIDAMLDAGRKPGTAGHCLAATSKTCRAGGPLGDHRDQPGAATRWRRRAKPPELVVPTPEQLRVIVTAVVGLKNEIAIRRRAPRPVPAGTRSSA